MKRWLRCPLTQKNIRNWRTAYLHGKGIARNSDQEAETDNIQLTNKNGFYDIRMIEEQTPEGCFILIICRDAFLEGRINTSTEDIARCKSDVHEILHLEVRLDNLKEPFCLSMAWLIFQACTALNGVCLGCLICPDFQAGVVENEWNVFWVCSTTSCGREHRKYWTMLDKPLSLVLRSDYWDMSLPKKMCKWDHMPKSMVWVLFNSKMWGREMERNRNWEGVREGVREID